MSSSTMTSNLLTCCTHESRRFPLSTERSSENFRSFSLSDEQLNKTQHSSSRFLGWRLCEAISFLFPLYASPPSEIKFFCVLYTLWWEHNIPSVLFLFLKFSALNICEFRCSPCESWFLDSGKGHIENVIQMQSIFVYTHCSFQSITWLFRLIRHESIPQP